MHAANKMLNRMEDAIDCVKWYQYNHLIFRDKQQERRNVHLVYETMPYDYVKSQVWSTVVQEPAPVVAENKEPLRRQRDRYAPYRGSRPNSP